MPSTKNEKETCKLLQSWSERFPEKVELYAADHWKLTQLLEELGKNIAMGSCRHSSTYMLFLMMVAVWKNPHPGKLEKSLRNILTNSAVDVERTFNDGLEIYRQHVKDRSEPSMEDERKLIDTFGRLSGLGASEGGRAIVSAVLRFLDPFKYGTVDYRNWCILSNTGCTLPWSQPLKKLGKSVEETKRIPIDTVHYLEYLGCIRDLGKKCNLSPAEVDMALFAYSDEVWPFKREQVDSILLTKSADKARRIMVVIDEIFREVSKIPNQKKRAMKLWNVMKLYERSGDYQSMYRFAKNAIRKGGRPLGATKTLESEFPRIEQIARNA